MQQKVSNFSIFDAEHSETIVKDTLRYLRLWLFFVFDTCVHKLPLVDWVKYLAKVYERYSWEVLVS